MFALSKMCKPYHDRPVHLNRGRNPHAWVCLACGKQLAGPALPREELDVLIEFFKSPAADLLPAKQAARAAEEKTVKLEVAMIVGPESKKWLMDMEGLLARMEKLAGAKTAAKAAPAEEIEEEEETPAVETVADEDDDFAKPVRKAAKKTASSFDDDDTEEEEEKEEKPVKKAAKAPKVTLDDVNDACREKCVALGGGKKAREQVVAILKKKFKAEGGTVTELKPEQYAAVVEAMRA